MYINSSEKRGRFICEKYKFFKRYVTIEYMWYQNMGWPTSNWGFGFINHWWGWIFPFAFVDLVLKGITLWKSAQAKEKWWFIALLVVNSLGILPVIYLLTHQTQPSKLKKK